VPRRGAPVAVAHTPQMAADAQIRTFDAAVPPGQFRYLGQRTVTREVAAV
jgi:hypothetical protein